MNELEKEQTIKSLAENFCDLTHNTIAYELAEQVIREAIENRTDYKAVIIRRKVCKNCEKTFMYWDEYHTDGSIETHSEKTICDECGGELEKNRIWQDEWNNETTEIKAE